MPIRVCSRCEGTFDAPLDSSRWLCQKCLDGLAFVVPKRTALLSPREQRMLARLDKKCPKFDREDV